MDADLLKKILEKMDEKVKIEGDDYVDFPKNAYRPFKISRSNFHSIRAEDSRKRIGFVDGGEACLMKSAGFSLHFIRTFAMIMEKKQANYSRTSEFFLLVSAASRNSRLYYQTTIFPVKKAIVPGAISIYSLDSRIKEKDERGATTSLSSIVRRIAELKMAAHLIDRLSEGDMIVLDGTLETRFASEQRCISRLYEKAEMSSVLVTGVAKSSNILTKNGNAAAPLLMDLGPEDAWYYHPVADVDNDMHLASIYFIKLHKRSKHVFRFEIYKKQDVMVDIGKVLGFIADGSKDLVLPGYPYWLIRTDKFARVTENEKEYLRTRLLSRLPKSLESYTDSDDVHKILDSVY